MIIGTACAHMFHYNCFMQWVDKENEDCPYCREHMISPDDFFQTAKDVLGVERVEKLKKVNDEAAARMEMLAARGTEGIPTPAPVVASHPSYQAAAGNTTTESTTREQAITTTTIEAPVAASTQEEECENTNETATAEEEEVEPKVETTPATPEASSEQ